MSNETSQDREIANTDPGAWAYIIVIGVIALITWGIIALYNKLTRTEPAVVSLSAYFVDGQGAVVGADSDESAQLLIKGDVHQAGAPLDPGIVRLFVAKQAPGFAQAVSVPLQNGRFEIKDAAFSALKPDDKIQIRALVTSGKLAEPATEELYLNMASPSLPPWIKDRLWIAAYALPLALLVAFFIAFTGKKTAPKNRAAIILSYCIIGVFITVPLLAPVLLLSAFPNARRAMVGAPVGLVITPIGDPPNVQTQWAVNIGGYSQPIPIPSPSPSPDTKATAATQTGTTTAAPATARTTPATSPQPSPTTPTGAVESSPSPPAASPTPTATQQATAAPTTSPSPVNMVAGLLGTNAELADVVKVDGGLVIPLYVIILSVIGGAINMTRKVPRFQHEGEYSELPSVASSTKRMVKNLTQSLTSKSGTSTAVTQTPEGQEQPVPVNNPAVTPPPRTPEQPEGDEPNLEEAAVKVDQKLDALVKLHAELDSNTKKSLLQVRDNVQAMRKLFESRENEKPLLGFASFEDWLAHRVELKEILSSGWRVELLNQYMYLISAPFLAIVAYYMLHLLGLTKQPILVLISFSVGLISERILSWLLGMASGYLRSEPNGQARTP